MRLLQTVAEETRRRTRRKEVPRQLSIRCRWVSSSRSGQFSYVFLFADVQMRKVAVAGARLFTRKPKDSQSPHLTAPLRFSLTDLRPIFFPPNQTLRLSLLSQHSAVQKCRVDNFKARNNQIHRCCAGQGLLAWELPRALLSFLLDQPRSDA